MRWFLVKIEKNKNLAALLMTAPTTSSANESQPSMSTQIQEVFIHQILKSLSLDPLSSQPSHSQLFQNIPPSSPIPTKEGVYQQVNLTAAFHDQILGFLQNK